MDKNKGCNKAKDYIEVEDYLVSLNENDLIYGIDYVEFSGEAKVRKSIVIDDEYVHEEIEGEFKCYNKDSKYLFSVKWNEFAKLRQLLRNVQYVVNEIKEEFEIVLDRDFNRGK